MYKEDNPNFKISFEGFVNGDSEGDIEKKPIATTTATNTSDVGEYKITTSGGNEPTMTSLIIPILSSSKRQLSKSLGIKTLII